MTTDAKIGLAVSGGGYRATLYSLGSIWRLNEFGLLPRLKTITSVSGGSITTGYLAIKWDQLTFNTDGVATNFGPVVADPLQAFCSQGIDVKSGLSGLFSIGDTIGDKVAKAYDRLLFHGANIQDLPDNSPNFLFYGTNYQTGSSLRIQKSAISDYKIGKYPNPDIPMAKVVGISSAFPPLFSPVTLKTDPNQWVKTKGADYFDDVQLRKKMILTDGGLYDNLGLEAIWKGKGKYTHILVCDAGAPFTVNHKIRTNWAGQLLRMTDLMTDQQRALRKRELVANYLDVDAEGNHTVYGGTYFGISSPINDYKLDDAMTVDSESTRSLRNIRTRLNAFSDEEQGHLINWGYALADAAIRKWAKELPSEKLIKEGQWPVPEYAF
jgi:NTE family protein